MVLHTIENDPEYINLQAEMVKMQQWIKDSNKRLLVIFEGRDAAGKGGAIMRFIRFLNPRYYRVVALAKPTESEAGQWYFQRYIDKLPNAGEIVFFDRSWYNRAVVEPVMNFCTEDQYNLFLQQVTQLERMLVEDGIIIIKFWFSIDINEQKKRLEERKSNPLIQWKLSTVDMQAQLKWDDFTRYKELMFAKTGTKTCPWIVVKGNNKDNARKEAMRYVLENIDYSPKGLTGVRLKANTDIVSVLGI
ncbi:polyphosphate kinase 2 [Carboxylicivirga caseinilyticus]|uniref:polyphosphate kinase 2 n=1 Tax=Carboxylicivirga caseinilyticus TaxID=3417572 RepID=UPI002AA74CCF|nr:polyphosphate kinase 2 [uncultured Carboxylicivirga sp.]MCU4164385.1 polyphosphate kinase 2 [Marinilabiliaceae bacterium A049]